MTAPHYPHGTFVWADLAVPDPDRVGTFYCSLFGWTAAEGSTDTGEPYITFSLGGRGVAGLYRRGEEEVAAGPTRRWASYVSVDELEPVVDRVSPLGGAVVADPRDVTGAGRTAVIEDPGGASVALWEPRRHAGAMVFNEPGSMTWNELATRDPERAAGFYRALFGWTVDGVQYEGTTYHLVRVGDRLNGGIIGTDEAMPDEASAGWMVLFAVGDVDLAVGKIQELGGSVPAPPVETPFGRRAVAAGPQGGTFSIVRWSVHVDPPLSPAW